MQTVFAVFRCCEINEYPSEVLSALFVLEPDAETYVASRRFEWGVTYRIAPWKVM